LSTQIPPPARRRGGACFTADAGRDDRKIVGESGRLHYAIAVNGEVECDDAWVNVPAKVNECDYEAPESPPKPSIVIETE